jgi:hypothetical protein
MPLQRVITDFGADVAFGQVPQKLLEHHGVSVPISSAQTITQAHAQKILEQESLETEYRAGTSIETLIAEIDGSMIPIVTTDAPGVEGLDRRKTRKLGWMEARLALVRAPEQTQPIFGVTLGDVNEAGAQLFDIAIRAGLSEETFVHGVGDGAVWIADQMGLRFSEPGRFLLDFYHLCDYLAAASHICQPQDPKGWMEQQKKRLKVNLSDKVLSALESFREADSVPDNKAPVRAAYRYINNRREQLDYQGAINADLPIGSGEIESAHRYVIQARLKLSGAWWNIDNAAAMLSLRVLRANGDWANYWQNSSPRAA